MIRSNRIISTASTAESFAVCQFSRYLMRTLTYRHRAASKATGTE
jgi:hypothetical protein